MQFKNNDGQNFIDSSEQKYEAEDVCDLRSMAKKREYEARIDLAFDRAVEGCDDTEEIENLKRFRDIGKSHCNFGKTWTDVTDDFSKACIAGIQRASKSNPMQEYETNAWCDFESHFDKYFDALKQNTSLETENYDPDSLAMSGITDIICCNHFTNENYVSDIVSEIVNCIGEHCDCKLSYNKLYVNNSLTRFTEAYIFDTFRKANQIFEYKKCVEMTAFAILNELDFVFHIFDIEQLDNEEN